MVANESRQLGRDSLFLMADMRIDGLDGDYRIKVRNLSAAGMMGEGSMRMLRGSVVFVNIRNIGWVEGTIAWVQGNRFGVAFRDEIDPRVARVPVSQPGSTPQHIRNSIADHSPGAALRKI
ncbi:MAG: PilZ domain-containing protein [Novosphingobium sp.]|nr:PilZ domain-containing protein [Novosphingobium sp.]